MKKNNKRLLIGGLIAFAVLVGIATYVFRDQLFRSVSVQPPETVQADRSSDTYKQYAAITGETYDRTFIANMIAHHQGAVDMARLALTNAKHQELKDMANNIISAQENEISEMTSWQKEWGYPSTSADNMMDHSSMGMMDEMAGMSASLEGKTGDEFDKAFLEQMIMHHQSAINMATPGEKNAKHQEVKDLTLAIVTAQTKEIEQMKQWQSDWAY
ncbi:MAG TPA: DUF305 domain-containing protein [Candidatus Saccharibacteria bacterium]|nr:DUF305 domain-containing protein [Candidatus Saccharibacteria bacterium]HRK94577.1 DUF305 domain-containing protein [Candidatus Saccharibacteria bacterium]